MVKQIASNPACPDQLLFVQYRITCLLTPSNGPIERPKPCSSAAASRSSCSTRRVASLRNRLLRPQSLYLQMIHLTVCVNHPDNDDDDYRSAGNDFGLKGGRRGRGCLYIHKNLACFVESWACVFLHIMGQVSLFSSK